MMHAAKNRSELRDIPRYWHDACEDDFPLGAFIGSVVLSGCYSTTSWESDEDDEAAGNWEAGRFAWRLTDPVKLSMPIPAKGQQGFWMVDQMDLLSEEEQRAWQETREGMHRCP